MGLCFVECDIKLIRLTRGLLTAAAWQIVRKTMKSLCADFGGYPARPIRRLRASDVVLADGAAFEGARVTARDGTHN
jgi:hypothetical protein